MSKITLENVLEIVQENSGATYYIATLVKNKYPNWERNVTEIRNLLKDLRDRGHIENYETCYKRQLSWRIRKDTKNQKILKLTKRSKR